MQKLKVTVAEESVGTGKVILSEEQDIKIRHQIFNAAKTGNCEILNNILQRYKISKAKFDSIQDDNGNSVLLMAVMTGDTKTLELLINEGCNVNHQNFDGNTPLHFAIRGRYYKCIDMILNAGADEAIENNLGKQAWEMQKMT